VLPGNIYENKMSHEHGLLTLPPEFNNYGHRFSLFSKVKVKVKFTPELAMKAQRGRRGIALLFL